MQLLKPTVLYHEFTITAKTLAVKRYIYVLVDIVFLYNIAQRSVGDRQTGRKDEYRAFLRNITVNVGITGGYSNVDKDKLLVT